MPKQQETMRTREQAAARILDLSGYLSSSRFIHRPFDQTVRTPVVGELEEIMRGLSRLGYEVCTQLSAEGKCLANISSFALFLALFHSQTLPLNNSSYPLYPSSLKLPSTDPPPFRLSFLRRNSSSILPSPFQPPLPHFHCQISISRMKSSTSSSTTSKLIRLSGDAESPFTLLSQPRFNGAGSLSPLHSLN